jgi:hypothetical protein
VHRAEVFLFELEKFIVFFIFVVDWGLFWEKINRNGVGVDVFREGVPCYPLSQGIHSWRIVVLL